jgi:hypothetical protein
LFYRLLGNSFSWTAVAVFFLWSLVNHFVVPSLILPSSPSFHVMLSSTEVSYVGSFRFYRHSLWPWLTCRWPWLSNVLLVDRNLQITPCPTRAWPKCQHFFCRHFIRFSSQLHNHSSSYLSAYPSHPSSPFQPDVCTSF